MKPRPGITVAAVICTLAFITPILVSLGLAWRQSIADEKAQGVRYAAEVVRRGEETGGQFARAIQLLKHDHFAPCSSQEIELMRQIDVGSSYLQMVGRVSGNTLECTSLGTTQPMTLGRPTLTTEHGVNERLDVHFGPGRWDHLDLLDRDGVAVLIDSSLEIDQNTEENGVGLAMIVPSNAEHARLAESTQQFRSNWLNPVGRGQSQSFTDGGYFVSQVRSSKVDIAGISIVPSRYAYAHIKKFTATFVPIGCLCGIGLAWAVLYISRYRSSLTGLVRAASKRGEFFVEYQPVVEIATRRVVGAEALVRLRRGNTIISPSNFIGLAEESGAARIITENVLRLVSGTLPKLLDLRPDFHIAINLTATDLKWRGTVERLEDLLRQSGASPRNVIIEATEHGMVSGPECSEMISSLRRRGFRVAIDDFGTGYSCLSRLQEIDLDLLKIDRSFVDTIGTHRPTREVVLHIIEIARAMQLHIVAEGVETEAQSRFLLEHGVEYAQGWLFGRPMSASALCELLAESAKSASNLQPAYADDIRMEISPA
jgi:sensor c-di-GMP phosphodiesterase-like protein